MDQICGLQWRCGLYDLRVENLQYLRPFCSEKPLKGQLQVHIELQNLWSVEMMFDILWPKEGVRSVCDLGGAAKIISMRNNVIFHELFKSPVGKSALWPASIASKVSSKAIFGKTSALSKPNHQQLFFHTRLPGLTYTVLTTQATPLMTEL